MGMADPKLGSYRMRCCGVPAPHMWGKPGGKGFANEWWEVEKCPNEYCPTNRKEPIKFWTSGNDPI